MVIGLYGGSFNPPHAGHVLVAERALRALNLDRLWWMVTPGNPLKENSALPPLAARMAACRGLVRDPRIVVTGFEAAIGARYSVETAEFLVRRCPGVRFVWVMGADSLASFHRWKAWRRIAALMPLAVVDRPGATLKATAGLAAQALWPARLDEQVALRLALRHPPAWVFLYGRRLRLSSTDLRGKPQTSR